MKNFLTILAVFISCTLMSQEKIGAYKVRQDHNGTGLSKIVTYVVTPGKRQPTRDYLFHQETWSLSETQYRKSGYSKCQVFPPNLAATLDHSFKAFNMKNVWPMHPTLHSGLWKMLERRVEELANTSDSVRVICGFTGIMFYKHGLPIPTSYYKIIYTFKEGMVSREKYRFPNESPVHNNLINYLKSM